MLRSKAPLSEGVNTLAKNAAYVVFAFAIVACGEGGGKASKQKTVEVDEKGNLVIYHTLQRPGKWKPQRFDHSPLTEVKYPRSKKQRHKTVAITVPLKLTDKRHYIETILLMDHGHTKEFGKVVFEPGDLKFEAKFKLPREYPYPVYAIAKCNLHDMWETRVAFEPDS